MFEVRVSDALLAKAHERYGEERSATGTPGVEIADFEDDPDYWPMIDALE